MSWLLDWITGYDAENEAHAAEADAIADTIPNGKRINPLSAYQFTTWGR